VKVPAFNGSSRGGANSQTLLVEAIRGVKEQGAEVTVYNLNDANIRPRQNSGTCDREACNAR
jgi:multimeric flavodoxin WrbA